MFSRTVRFNQIPPDTGWVQITFGSQICCIKGHNHRLIEPDSLGVTLDGVLQDILRIALHLDLKLYEQSDVLDYKAAGILERY